MCISSYKHLADISVRIHICIAKNIQKMKPFKVHTIHKNKVYTCIPTYKLQFSFHFGLEAISET